MRSRASKRKMKQKERKIRAKIEEGPTRTVSLTRSGVVTPYPPPPLPPRSAAETVDGPIRMATDDPRGGHDPHVGVPQLVWLPRGDPWGPRGGHDPSVREPLMKKIRFFFRLVLFSFVVVVVVGPGNSKKRANR